MPQNRRLDAFGGTPLRIAQVDRISAPSLWSIFAAGSRIKPAADSSRPNHLKSPPRCAGAATSNKAVSGNNLILQLTPLALAFRTPRRRVRNQAECLSESDGGHHVYFAALARCRSGSDGRCCRVAVDFGLRGKPIRGLGWL